VSNCVLVVGMVDNRHATISHLKKKQKLGPFDLPAHDVVHIIIIIIIIITHPAS